MLMKEGRMIPYRKILFPVDFSKATVAMVPSVVALARSFDATMTILNAFNLAREYSLAPNFEDTRDSEPSAIPYTESLQEFRDQRERNIEEFARMQFSDISHSALIIDGESALVIEWVAQHEHADLIMMPTLGLGQFRRMLLGPVTARVLHDVTCPVLTSVDNPEATMPLFNDLRSILCAVNFSSQSDEVFQATSFLAQVYGAKIRILHIEPMPSESVLPSTPQEIIQSFERATASSLSGLCAPPSVRIMDADIPGGIRQAAIEEKADLVVVGRGHSQETFSRAWSHLYSIIRESPCPILSI